MRIAGDLDLLITPEILYIQKSDIYCVNRYVVVIYTFAPV